MKTQNNAIAAMLQEFEAMVDNRLEEFKKELKNLGATTASNTTSPLKTLEWDDLMVA